MIKIKYDKYRAYEIVTDEYDNIIFEIDYNGYFINFLSNKEYEYKLLTAEEYDIIINYLIGISIRYNYKFNAYSIYDRLAIGQNIHCN